MDIIETDDGADWRHEFTCGRCRSTCAAGPDDLEADEFKVSGHHFDGSAVCNRRLYVTCVVCGHLEFLDADTAAAVPYLLDQRADGNRERILAAARSAATTA